jgi:CDP-6-deoxy-D-xylo-4-hexulose-3-dehydrase
MIKFDNENTARGDILGIIGDYCDCFHDKKSAFKPGDKIPYAGRIYDKEEMINLVDSALDFWLTAGKYTEKFEKEFAAYLTVNHCVLVNSGSSANLLAFATLMSPLLGERAVKPGDEVITVAAGFPTTIAPIIQLGAIPVFVDITIPEYNIDISMLEEAYSKKTKAVILAHTLGNPFDLNAVKSFCDKYNLWLIEDNCDALGSKYEIDGKFKLTGTIGDIGTSSFYPPHHITMGEGGAVYTDNPLIFKIALSIRDWGRDCACPPGTDGLCGHRYDGVYGELPRGYDHKYVYSHFGFNLKATDMQAAIGCAQLKKFPSFAKKRRQNFMYLHNRLSGSSQFILPKAKKNSDPCWFGFLLTCKEGLNREKVVRYVESKGVQTRMLFAGNIIKHPCFDEMRKTNTGFRVIGSLENTNRAMNDTFWVGVYPGMTNDMLDYIAEALTEVVNYD